MNNTVLGFLMVVSGLGLASGGVLVLMKRHAGLPPVAGSVENPAPTPSSSPAPLTPEEKGRKFEGWVVRKFNPAYFAIKDWRGDKHEPGVYPESSQNPDLEIEFRLRDLRELFAVECKWRRSFDQGEKPGVEWATEQQIANYQAFQRTRGIPVFVVIGIGGAPDDPAELYIAALDRLKYPFATAAYLAKFRRTNTQTQFYFDPKTPELR